MKNIKKYLIAIITLGMFFAPSTEITSKYSIDNPPPAEHPLFEEIDALNKRLDELSLLIKNWGA